MARMISLDGGQVASYRDLIGGKNAAPALPEQNARTKAFAMKVSNEMTSTNDVNLVKLAGHYKIPTMLASDANELIKQGLQIFKSGQNSRTIEVKVEAMGHKKDELSVTIMERMQNETLELQKNLDAERALGAPKPSQLKKFS
jgi:hypothetical protein